MSVILTHDFVLLPPEVNSGLMYAGSGAGPLIDTATAWAELAEALNSNAAACTAILSALTSTAWQGGAATEMAATITPYANWLQDLAGHAATAATHATAAANAYQSAFTAIIPPPVITANRTQHAQLTATNIFGQNSAAIAETDTAYQAMWAHDANTMYTYAAESAAATANLNPLTQPPAPTTQTTTPTTATTPDPTGLLSTLQTALHSLATPGLDGWNIFSSANDSTTSGLSGLLNAIDGATPSTLGDLLNSGTVVNTFTGGVLNPSYFVDAFSSFDYLIAYGASDYARGITGAGAGALGGVGGVGMGEMTMSSLSSASSAADRLDTPSPTFPTAGVGKATLVGSLSVPQSWTALSTPAHTGVPLAMATSPPLPVTSPVITAAMPSSSSPLSTSARMVDKAEDEEEETPIYGSPTKALVRTPAGG